MSSSHLIAPRRLLTDLATVDDASWVSPLSVALNRVLPSTSTSPQRASMNGVQ